MNFRSYNHLNDFDKLISKSGGSIYLAGSGILPSVTNLIKNSFIESKFPGEIHLKGANFMGPHTRLDIRTSGYPDYLPNGYIGISTSKLDSISRDHDISYDKIKRDYLQNGNKTELIKQIHEADDKYINEALRDGLKD